MPPLVGSDNLAFLDGYLFRVMVEILRSEGADASGLYDYYKARIEREGTALSAYDRVLVDYVLAHFDRQHRRVVHAGSGLGTLTAALVMAGYQVAGIERDAQRFRAASRVRATLADAWPAAVERYELITGEFPTAVADTGWTAPETILIFTNCGAGWSADFTKRIIASFPSYGDVVLDLRLFGNVRESQAEREDLVDQITASGLAAEPIAGMPSGSFYYHVQHRSAP